MLCSQRTYLQCLLCVGLSASSTNHSGQCSPITDPLPLFPLQSSFYFFPNDRLWIALFISAIAGPLLKWAASGNTLTVIITQNIQKHGSDLHKKSQRRMTKYCSVLSSQLSTSLSENWEFRSSTGVQMLLSSHFTRERKSDKCLY